MASLALLMAWRAIVNLVLSNKAYYLPDNLYVLDRPVVKGIILVAIVLVIIYIWKFTRFGNYVRGIGETKLL